MTYQNDEFISSFLLIVLGLSRHFAVGFYQELEFNCLVATQKRQKIPYLLGYMFLSIHAYCLSGMLPENNLIEVQIIVRDIEGEALKNVQVEVVGNGAPEIRQTDDSGYARVEIPDRSDVDIVLSKDGYLRQTRTINLLTDPNRTKPFTLEKSSIESSSKGLIPQHYTSYNEFLPITLSVVSPDMNIPGVRNAFKEAFGIESPPFLDWDNPIREVVEIFKRETGISEEGYLNQTNGSGFIYASRNINSSETTEGSVDYLSGSPSYQKNTRVETEEEFERRILEESSVCGLTSCILPIGSLLSDISFDKEDQDYTALVSYNESDSLGVDGEFIQYPKLGDFDPSEIRTLKETIYGDAEEDLWIRGLIENNPKHRGFIAFSYPYSNGEIDYHYSEGGCGLSYPQLKTYMPTPYVKFLDLENTLDTSIKLKGFSYKIIEKDAHELTNTDRRNEIFHEIKKMHYNETNLVLKPGQHFWIPTEFGFDTRSQKSEIEYLARSHKEGQNTPNKINITKASFVTENEFPNPDHSSSAEKTRFLMKEVEPHIDFWQSIKSVDKVLNNVPSHFAVGSIISVESISIEETTYQVEPPNNNSIENYVSKFFRIGC